MKYWTLPGIFKNVLSNNYILKLKIHVLIVKKPKQHFNSNTGLVHLKTLNFTQKANMSGSYDIKSS